MFGQTQANEAPFLGAGVNALQTLQNLTGTNPAGTNPDGTPLAAGTGSGPLNAPFTTADFQSSPGYQFQVQQGQNAIENQASVGGFGGNTLKALTTFGEGVANQDYWNAYNAYVGQQNQQFNQLSSIAGIGENAAGALNTAGTNVANNVGNIATNSATQIGNNTIGAGNANAAGTVASTNALSGGLNSLASNYFLSNLLNSGGGGGNPFASGAFSAPAYGGAAV